MAEDREQRVPWRGAPNGLANRVQAQFRQGLEDDLEDGLADELGQRKQQLEEESREACW